MTKIIKCCVRTKTRCLCFHKHTSGLVSSAPWEPRRQRGGCCGYQDITFPSLSLGPHPSHWLLPPPLSRILPLRARPDSMGWEQTPASSPGARLCSFPGIVLVEVLKSKNKSTQERIKQIGIPKRTGYAHLVVLTLLLKPPLSAAWWPVLNWAQGSEIMYGATLCFSKVAYETFKMRVGVS